MGQANSQEKTLKSEGRSLSEHNLSKSTNAFSPTMKQTQKVSAKDCDDEDEFWTRQRKKEQAKTNNGGTSKVQGGQQKKGSENSAGPSHPHSSSSVRQNTERKANHTMRTVSYSKSPTNTEPILFNKDKMRLMEPDLRSHSSPSLKWQIPDSKTDLLTIKDSPLLKTVYVNEKLEQMLKNSSLDPQAKDFERKMTALNRNTSLVDKSAQREFQVTTVCETIGIPTSEEANHGATQIATHALDFPPESLRQLQNEAISLPLSRSHEDQRTIDEKPDNLYVNLQNEPALFRNPYNYKNVDLPRTLDRKLQKNSRSFPAPQNYGRIWSEVPHNYEDQSFRKDIRYDNRTSADYLSNGWNNSILGDYRTAVQLQANFDLSWSQQHQNYQNVREVWNPGMRPSNYAGYDFNGRNWPVSGESYRHPYQRSQSLHRSSGRNQASDLANFQDRNNFGSLEQIHDGRGPNRFVPRGNAFSDERYSEGQQHNSRPQTRGRRRGRPNSREYPAETNLEQILPKLAIGPTERIPDRGKSKEERNPKNLTLKIPGQNQTKSRQDSTKSKKNFEPSGPEADVKKRWLKNRKSDGKTAKKEAEKKTKNSELNNQVFKKGESLAGGPSRVGAAGNFNEFCPLCYEPIAAARYITLDCNHRLHMSCALDVAPKVRSTSCSLCLELEREEEMN